MGGITKALFGGSKSKSTQTSDNQAYPTLLGMLSPNVGLGNSAMSTLGGLLGIGGPEAAAGADGTLKNFLNSTGFNFMLDSGRNAITGSQATKGLFNSGSTGKALTKFGQNLGSTAISDLMGKLTSLGNYGLGSAQVIEGAGNRSTGTSSGSSSSGIFNSLFPGGLSDRRAKMNIVHIENLSDGLGVYDYEYMSMPGKVFRGVMADEVAKLRPEALGPELENGFQTVVYAKIPEMRHGPQLMTGGN